MQVLAPGQTSPIVELNTLLANARVKQVESSKAIRQPKRDKLLEGAENLAAAIKAGDEKDIRQQLRKLDRVGEPVLWGEDFEADERLTGIRLSVSVVLRKDWLAGDASTVDGRKTMLASCVNISAGLDVTGDVAAVAAVDLWEHAGILEELFEAANWFQLAPHSERTALVAA